MRPGVPAARLLPSGDRAAVLNGERDVKERSTLPVAAVTSLAPRPQPTPPRRLPSGGPTRTRAGGPGYHPPRVSLPVATSQRSTTLFRSGEFRAATVLPSGRGRTERTCPPRACRPTSLPVATSQTHRVLSLPTPTRRLPPGRNFRLYNPCLVPGSSLSGSP